MEPIRIVTHSGAFHADDVFAAATLSLFYKKEGREISIMRTRDASRIESADIVFDVGGEYESTKKRFDHHQMGGAGTHESGIPYAAFGLVWKEYGQALAGSKALADRIEQSIVEPIDAFDNGVDVFELISPPLSPITINTLIGVYNATWKEDEENVQDTHFMEMVTFAEAFLSRSLASFQTQLEIEESIARVYEGSESKSLLVFDIPFGRVPLQMALSTYSDVLFAVFPGRNKEDWKLIGLPDQETSLRVRKALPLPWAGLRDDELAAVTGVPDAVFCHNGRFLAVAKSREGALELARQALGA